jgi:hypothetical protein
MSRSMGQGIAPTRQTEVSPADMLDMNARMKNGAQPMHAQAQMDRQDLQALMDQLGAGKA